MANFPRRFLPPMSQLCAFESAARHQSFTAAATELNLTQSAVSRQIRALEDLLGCPLFVRDKQTVRITPAGAAYAQEVREALRRVSKATLGFRTNPEGGNLNLAIRPTFGTRWLAPRLPRFSAAHPGVSINLTTRFAPFDFQTDQIDAAIHVGLPDWPGAKLDFLRKETVVPVCSRQMRDHYRFVTPSDLLHAPLLHLVGRPDAWAHWFAEMNVDCKQVSGMQVDQFTVAAQAANAGLGVALLPIFLIEIELSRGDLVVAIDKPIESREHYYLAWPTSRENYPPLMAFHAWIKSELELEAGR